MPAIDAQSERHDAYAALRVRNYRRYVVSLLAMTMATQIQGVVVAWQIYAVTRDPLSLGLIGLAEAFPYIGLALYAGHVADRHDRRRIALGALWMLLLCSCTFLAFSMAPATFLSHGAWPFYVVIFVSGVARSFLQPARTALSAELIPRTMYANAVAWRSSIWQTAAVVGPALGGLLYGFASATTAYAVDVALLGVAAVTFIFIAYESPDRRRADEPVSESLTSGVRFVFSEPVLLGALTLDLFSVLLGGAEALLPIFASEILHAGPQGLGILRAAPAAGAVVMSLYMAHREPLRHAGSVLLSAVAAFALCIIGFGLSTNFFLSVALLCVSGMADNLSVLIRSTLLQVKTPSHLLGRVSSVNAIFVGSSNELGAFESGVAAKLLGTVPSVIFGGAASLLVVAAVGIRIPMLRRLGRLV